MGRGGEGKGRGKGGDVKSNCMLLFGFGSSPSPLTACSFLPPSLPPQGALAMEALHRQVLPFMLRRMKEDVLQDLPPKIIQDYHCDLSPLQVSAA